MQLMVNDCLSFMDVCLAVAILQYSKKTQKTLKHYATKGMHLFASAKGTERGLLQFHPDFVQTAPNCFESYYSKIHHYHRQTGEETTTLLPHPNPCPQDNEL